MNNNKVAFIYAVNDPKKFKESKSTIDQLKVPDGCEVEVISIEGAESLTAAYNTGMYKSHAKYKVYLHQDVYILNENLLENIIKLFKKYPKLGLIGAVGAKILPGNGIWSESKERYGKADESSAGYKRPLRNLDIEGDYESVQAVDGLVMITQYDLPWRDDIFKGWHFYDTSQCFEFLKAGYEVGIPKQEDSPWFEHDCGIVDLTGYEENRELFLKHYSKDIQRLYPIDFNQYFSYHMELFLEFIDVSRELSYKGIPLALLIRFEQYIDKELHDYIIQNRKRSTLQIAEIQPSFDRIVNDIKKKTAINKIKPRNNKDSGKTLIYNSSVLRFPTSTFVEYFDPNKTIILERDYEGDYKGIPIRSISKYRKNSWKYYNKVNLEGQLVNQANNIFESNRTHPLFSNENFRNKFLEEIPGIIENLITAEEYFRNNSPSCIIMGQTGDIDVRVFALLAAIHEIPCICTQHGLIMGKLDTCYFPVFANAQAVYGNYEKEYYLQYGVSEDKIEVTGHPRFDAICNQLNMNKHDLSEAIGFDINKKLVLIATTPEFDYTLLITDEPSYYWNDYVEYLVNNPNVEIIIKPTFWEYQNEHLMKGYLELSQKYKAVKLLGSEPKLYDVLPFVDIVAVENSTVGLEAMLFDKQTVCLAKEQSFLVDTFNYYGRLDCFIQTDPKKLAEITNRFFEDLDLQNHAKIIRNEFIEKSYINRKYLASNQLLELVLKLTGAEPSISIGWNYEGSLITGPDQKVYFIENGMKRHIVSPSVFKKLGFNWGDIKILNEEILERIPTGFLIK
ncbi:glycosyltransferase [Cytobacillus firmus]|uniref:glycosyltransferase n=1 Tax=Cytobacillus firmus TaxID=1399 RepID=UPI0021626B47|nr:glycosyltransferase [Cytobacillus firmus]MCS0674064.1 glycosyltransferase [Cytobacillus firmus]